MAVAPAPFDPFAAAGWQPIAPSNDNGGAGVTTVIDVAQPYDPAAKPGDPGSEFAVSRTSGQGSDKMVAPVDPKMERANFQDAISNVLGEPLAPRETSSAAAVPAKSSPETHFDPLAAAGWTKETAATLPPAIAQQEVRNQPWYQPIHDAVSAATKLQSGMTDEAAHAATLGLDNILLPLVPAITEALTTGKPFAKAYEEHAKAQRAPRKEFEEEHPNVALATGLAGSVVGAAPLAPLFGAVSVAGMPATSTALTLGRNAAAGAGTGAATAFTSADGDIAARTDAAKQGAEFGGALSVAAPAVVTGFQRLKTAATGAFSKKSTIDQLAGQALREGAGLEKNAPVPTPTPSPVPGMPIGAGAAMDSPGLAAMERRLNTTDDAGALAVRTGQNAAVRDLATTPQAGGVRLGRPVDFPEASASMVEGMQRAHAILKDEEERLWTRPELVGAAPDIGTLVTRVQRAIGAMPQRFQNALARNADVYGALQDLYALPAGSSLADINAVRSDILSASRGLPYSERFARAAADKAAAAVLDAIESNPNLRSTPAVLNAYQRARDFTRGMREALDKPQFQRMLQAVDGNRKGLDPGTIASEAFKFGAGTERTPGGIARIVDLLDGVSRQWGMLAAGNHGVPLPGLTPAASFAARTQLLEGARDVITNSMLDAAASNVRDQAGAQSMLMNKLSDWIDTNRGWIGRSRLFTPAQIGLLDRIREGSILAARQSNYRGGTGSETYERAMGDRYADVFMGPFMGHASGTATGAVLGAIATKLFGEVGIGGLIGMELTGAGGGFLAGPAIMRRLYQVPRQRLIERINEAIRDPVIAEDLMRKAGATVSPRTKAWAQSLITIAPVEHAAESFGGGQ